MNNFLAASIRPSLVKIMSSQTRSIIKFKKKKQKKLKIFQAFTEQCQMDYIRSHIPSSSI